MPPLEAEHKKQLNRREELLKQDVSLRKDYSVLLRKIASVCQVLELLGEQPAEFRAADYGRFAEWDALVPLLQSLERTHALPAEQVEIPDSLQESYELFKMTPLLHKDGEHPL